MINQKRNKIITLIRKVRHKFIDLTCRIYPKPKVLNHKKVNELIAFSSNNVFQFNYFLKLKSGFEINHIRNQIVLFDILKNNIFRNKSKIKFSEYACLDGYLSWNLSMFFKNITAVDINRNNIEKIKLVNKIFKTSIKTLNIDISNIKTKFNIITLLGCTYQLEKPLTEIKNIILNQISKDKKGILYVDFRYWSEADFLPKHTSLNTNNLDLYFEEENMPVALKYTIDHSDEYNHINHPENCKSTLFYRESDILNFIKNIKKVSKVEIIGRDTYTHPSNSVNYLVLKILC